MIRPLAARSLATRLLKSLAPDLSVDQITIDLLASLISSAVAVDEKEAEIELAQQRHLRIVKGASDYGR